MINDVHVLIRGLAEWAGPGKQRAWGTVTLITRENNIVVDTGIPLQKDELIQRLEEHNLAPADIDFVVITHGHSDHIGNNNLFPEATFILDTDVSRGDEMRVHDFHADAFLIEKTVAVVSTPGHTDHDLSVVVETESGTCVIAGDIFEKDKDWDDKSWEPWSKHKDNQTKSRERILRIADFIVPGHGDAFEVPPLLSLNMGPARKGKGGSEYFLNSDRIRPLAAELARKFQTHWSPVDEDLIRDWLRQFGGYYDAQSMFPLLENINYIDNERIRDMFAAFCENTLSSLDREAVFSILGSAKDSSSPMLYTCSVTVQLAEATVCLSAPSIVFRKSSPRRPQVASTLISIACFPAPFQERWPPEIFRFTTYGRSARSARLFVASTPGQAT